MKTFKVLVAFMVTFLLSLMPVFAQVVTTQATVKSVATDARNDARSAKDKIDEARGAIALEEASVAAAQKAVGDKAVADRPAAQRAVDERVVALTIAKKRLQEVIAKCKCAPVTRKKVATRSTQGSNAEVVRALAMANADLRAGANVNSAKIVFVGSSSTARFPVEGKVYSDAEGNTFERHQGGSRECKFYVNGELVKRMFVQHPDPRESKKQCDLLSQEFYSTMSGTTPEETSKEVSKETSYKMSRGNARSSATASASAGVATGGYGNHTCELKFDGKVVETTKTVDDPACKAWTLAKAKEKGWTAR